MTEYKQASEDSSRSVPISPLIGDTSQAEAIITTLKHVCEETDWEYGEVWLPKAGNTILELSPAWHVTTRIDSDRQFAWEQFRSCSEEFILHPGEGLPGRVWSSQQPEWIADVSSQSEFYFLRNHIAKAFGAKTGLGIPIVEEQLQLILVFFMSKICDENKQLMASTQAVIEQVQPLLPRFN